MLSKYFLELFAVGCLFWISRTEMLPDIYMKFIILRQYCNKFRHSMERSADILSFVESTRSSNGIDEYYSYVNIAPPPESTQFFTHHEISGGQNSLQGCLFWITQFLYKNDSLWHAE
jgi:hypothetical protein